MILVDSSVFIGLADNRDQWHVAAKKIIPHIAKSKPVISGLILAEAVTAIGRRGGGKAADRLYHYLTDSCEIVSIDEKILQEAMQVFVKYDGTLPVSDAVSVHIMEVKNIRNIASFDSDFDKVDGIVRIH